MDPVIGLISSNYTNSSFGPLLEDRSFASLPFGGRYRLIDFPLSNMVNSGIRTIGLITPSHYRSLLDHVGIGTEWGITRKIGGLFMLAGSAYGFVTEHGKFLLRDFLANREYFDRAGAPYVLMSASNKVYNMDYSPLITKHISSGVDCTFLYKDVVSNSYQEGPFLQLDADSRITGYDFTSTTGGARFMDCMIMSTKLLNRIMDDFSEMGHMDLVSLLLNHKDTLNLSGFRFDGYVGDVDTLQEYISCNRDLFDRAINRELFWGQNRIHTKVQDSAPTKFMPGSQVTNSYISSGSIIEGTVENSIIFRNVHVKKGAVVRNSIIMQHGDIGEHAFLDNVICDKFVTISNHVNISGTPENTFVIEKRTKY